MEDTKMKIIKTFSFFGVILAGVLLFGNLNEVSAQRSGSMEWRGTVDDHVQVVIRGRNARVVTQSGTPYDDDRSNFSGGNRQGHASVHKEDGRGKVRVAQQPSRRNFFTTIIQIDDTKGGADRYRFRVTWN